MTTTPSSDIEIRHYLPQDKAACRALWGELTGWHRKLYSSEKIGGPNPELQFDEHLENVGPENIWVAVGEGRVVAFVGLIPGEGSAELEPVVISEPFRGRGIGRELAQAVIQRAKDNGTRQLTVRPVARNAEAIRFFHELGFRVIGQVDLFMDFTTENRNRWVEGETLADRDFLI